MSRASFVALSLLAAFAFPLNLAAQPKLLPVDDATKDPSFFVFRARLMEALVRHDAEFVIGILDPSILNSYGGDGGIPEFKEMWKINEGASPLWKTLGSVLSLGGKFSREGEFFAPYTFAAWPEDLDAFDYFAVVSEGVRIRRQPDLESEILGKLSFDIVRVLEWPKEGAPWIKIKMNGGEQGYVASEFVRSPVDYRAIFKKVDGRWRMTTFVAGD